MEKTAALERFAGIILASVLSFALMVSPALADTNPPPTEAKAAFASVQQLQEQHQATLRALDEIRRSTEAASKQNTDTLSSHLQLIEQALSAQRQPELESMQRSNQLSLIVAGAMVAAAFLGMLLTVFLFLRAMNRQPALAPALSFQPVAAYGQSAPTFGVGPVQLAPLSPAEQSSARFLGAIEQLEKRIQELQHAAAASPAGSQNSHPISDSDTFTSEALREPPEGRTAPPKDSECNGQTELTLGKGQMLLNLNQPENALVCFDEVIALDPTNTEALVKKGQTLEKLRRLEEAIDTYDRAIAMDSSVTSAYLYKAGVLNRLERFDKALECYEQALRRQENKTLPPTSVDVLS